MRRGSSVRQGPSSRVWGADFSLRGYRAGGGRRSFLSASKDGRMWYPSMRFGGMAEWLKALVLKTSRVKALVGSNPTSSARLFYPVSIARGGVLFCVKVHLLSIYRRRPARPLRSPFVEESWSGENTLARGGAGGVIYILAARRGTPSETRRGTLKTGYWNTEFEEDPRGSQPDEDS